MTPCPPIDDPAFEAWVRDSILELASAAVGLSADGDPAAFAALVAPGETPSRQREMMRVSTCGLFCRGLLGPAGLGCCDARLVAPYRDGRVFEDLLAMAREADAVLTRLADVQRGDVCVVSRPEHGFVVESIDEGQATTIQGGETDEAHAQCIERIVRPIQRGQVVGRPLEFAINVAALAARFLP